MLSTEAFDALSNEGKRAYLNRLANKIRDDVSDVARTMGSIIAERNAEIARLRAALDKEREVALRDLHRELIECGREWQANGHRPTHDDYLRQVDLAARRAAEAKEPPR